MLTEEDLHILADRTPEGSFRYGKNFGNFKLQNVYQKIDDIIMSKLGYIPKGGKERNNFLIRFQYKQKRDLRPKSTLWIEYEEQEKWTEDKVHCKWCEFLGLNPLHSISYIEFESARTEGNGICKYLGRYRNRMRTPEELATASGGRINEDILKLFRKHHLNEPILPNNVLNKICLEKYGEECFKCGSTENIAIDHILPLSRFYAKTEKNILPLCKSCNSSKQDKWPSEFYTPSELIKLSEISEYSLSELKNPTYNYDFIDWFVENNEFVYDYINKNRGKKEEYWERLIINIESIYQKRQNALHFI